MNYILEFDYSARKNGAASPLTSQAEIVWNDVVIASLIPQDFNVYHFNSSVKLKAGANTLAFDSAGISDGYGLIIDNVKLTSVYNSNNLISNGNFALYPLFQVIGTTIIMAFLTGGLSKLKLDIAELFTTTTGLQLLEIAFNLILMPTKDTSRQLLFLNSCLTLFTFLFKLNKE